jgi:hypothetical protein
MATLNGSFSGTIKSQSVIVVPGQSGHDLSLTEVTGTQKSADPNWNNASLTYCGITDILDGKGTQRGYFQNGRADGDRDWGTFEARVVTVNGLLLAEGTYQNTGGTGKFKGITGGGIFNTRMTSLRNVEATYEGTYQLTSAKAAG